MQKGEKDTKAGACAPENFQASVITPNSGILHAEITMSVADMTIGPMKEFLEEGRFGVSLRRSVVHFGHVLKIIGF
jgi:hypothetical protein